MAWCCAVASDVISLYFKTSLQKYSALENKYMLNFETLQTNSDFVFGAQPLMSRVSRHLEV